MRTSSFLLLLVRHLLLLVRHLFLIASYACAKVSLIHFKGKPVTLRSFLWHNSAELVNSVSLCLQSRSSIPWVSGMNGAAKVMKSPLMHVEQDRKCPNRQRGDKLKKPAQISFHRLLHLLWKEDYGTCHTTFSHKLQD